MILRFLLFFLACLPLSNPTFCQSGQLDPSFGVNGIVTYWSEIGSETAKRVLEDDQGRLVILGSGQYTVPPLYEIPYVNRLHPNGDLDLNFGDSGYVRLPDFGTSVFPEDMVYNPVTHKYYICGRISSQTGPLWDLIVLGIDSSGYLDTANFGTGGYLQFPTYKNSVYTSLEVQEDGKLILGGFQTLFDLTGGINDTTNFSVLRLFPTGLIDSSFGENGNAIPDYPYSTFDYFRDLKIDDQGRIFGIGYIRNQYWVEYPLAFRLSKDGNPDSSFHQFGYALIDSALARPFFTWSFEKTLDGGYVAAGTYGDVQGYPCLMRLDSNAGLVSNFGDQGFALYQTPEAGGFSDCIPQSDGRILVMGGMASFTSIGDILVGKFTSTGFPTAGRFGATGVEVYDFNLSYETGYDMILTRDSGIIVTGNDNFPLGKSLIFKLQNEFNVGIEEKVTPDENLLVCPNPFLDILNVRFANGVSGLASFRITNANGMVCSSGRSPVEKGQFQIAADQMERGFYILEVICWDEKISIPVIRK